MADPPSHMWYVKAAGGVWGPYPQARVFAFVAEGRVVGDTLVSPWAEGPFHPARVHEALATRMHARPAAPAAAAPAPAAALTPAAEAPAPDGPRRPLLVVAEVGEASAPGFHAALAATGPGVTIRPGLWLVQSTEGPAALRNRLSRRLRAPDTLLVLHAPPEQAAWFNLARDGELRRLWSASTAATATAP